MTTIENMETFKTREEWLAARRSGLGGTDAVAILGHSPYRSAYTVYAEKKLGLADKLSESESEQMLWGRVLEEPVRKEWERREKLIALPTPLTIIRDATHPFLFASPDALVDDDAGLEIKTASEWKREAWNDDVPLGYQIQIQHYLMVTDRARWHVAALIGGQKLVCATIHRNEGFISSLREGLVDWWNRHVIGDERPEIDGSESTSETIKRVFPPESAKGDTVNLPISFLTLHEHLAGYKAKRAELDKEIAAAENRIKAEIGTAQRGILPDGLGAYTFKPQHRDAYEVAASDYRVLRFSKKGE